MEEKLNRYIVDLLHIEEINKNKLIDLKAGEAYKTIYLQSNGTSQLSSQMLSLIIEKRGKPASVILKNSSLGEEQYIGNNLSAFDWKDAQGNQDKKKFNSFIQSVYQDISNKGNNPLFLSIGSIKWKLAIENELKEVETPLLIFPIKIVRSGTSTPLAIQFVPEEAYINPCLIEKLKVSISVSFAEHFPLPNEADEEIDLISLKDGNAYFEQVNHYISQSQMEDDHTLFELDSNVVAISSFNHDEVCMYFDIRRNQKKIESHPLVKQIFLSSKEERKPEEENKFRNAKYILDSDSNQKQMILDALNGTSLIIKGPPGSGKTLTIANMIAALLDQNKRILFASKKLAALSEVQAKLPVELRKFTLLLDAETEAEASKINASSFIKDLKSLLEDKKRYHDDQLHTAENQTALLNYETACYRVSQYAKKVFKEKVALQKTLYELLELFFEHESLPVLDIFSIDPFSMQEDLLSMTQAMLDSIDNYYQTITHHQTISFQENPWAYYDGKKGIDESYEAYQKLVESAKAIQNECAFLNDSYQQLPLKMILWLFEEPLVLDQCHFNLDQELQSKLDTLSTSFHEFLEKCSFIHPNVFLENQKELMELKKEFNALTLDKNISIQTWKEIGKYLYLFENENSSFLNEEDDKKLLSVYQQMVKIKEDKLKLENSFYRLFKKNLSLEEKEIISSSFPSLKKYVNGKEASPSILDFKAKSFEKRLRSLTFVEPTFIELVKGVDTYHQMEQLNHIENTLTKSLCMIFQRDLKEEEVQYVSLLLSLLKGKNVSLNTFIRQFQLQQPTLKKIVERFEIKNKQNTTLKDIENDFNYYTYYFKVKENFTYVNELTQLFKETDQDLIKKVKFTLALISFKKISSSEDDLKETLQELINKETLPEEIFQFLSQLNQFSIEYFTSYDSNFLSTFKLNRLSHWIDDVQDKNNVRACLEFHSLLHQKTYFNIEKFMNYFIGSSSIKKEDSFSQYFLHSFYGFTLAQYFKLHPEYRYGIGNQLEVDEDEIYRGNKQIEKQNVGAIENHLMSSIDKKNAQYSFLNYEKDFSSLRRLFYQEANSILSLKKCMILSPSTASILFRNNAYEHFDVLIVDEASQLEPSNLLPVLFRSQQCILVGDEWQMPPMKHFKSKTENISFEDNYDTPENSSLSLALKNGAFKTYELNSHYRSKTESLIHFSQKHFYPYMKTFPSPVPRKLDLGFKDIYVKEATCKQGVNVKEAEETIRQIKDLFSRYYQDGVLKESVGVVAFGEKQIETIQNLMLQDAELLNQIKQALSHHEDEDKEKIFFLKTIETVQGQEIDHLILSMTYGVTSDGRKTNLFGQLSHSKIGQCIFNVAVTRAKSSICVIHSILPVEIKDESQISFIKEYLYISKQFSQTGLTQFVGEQIKPGFVYQVKKFLIENQIAEDRIVYNYGVTNGSIRIPLVILDEKKEKALLGIWCEKNHYALETYIDESISYVHILENNGWNLYRLHLLDWYNNQETEKKKLLKAIQSINKGE